MLGLDSTSAGESQIKTTQIRQRTSWGPRLLEVVITPLLRFGGSIGSTDFNFLVT